MMTMLDHAISHFKYNLVNNCYQSDNLRQYANLALEALEKRKPMLVDHERTFWTYRHYCPACQEQLYMEALKYCPDCGQALDWSTYELGLKYVR
jgi:hypothetical protein